MNDPRPKMALRSLIQSHDNALNGDWHISAREDCLRLNAGQRIVCNQTIGGSLLESLLAVDIANDAVLSFFGPDLRPNLFLTTANCF